MRTSPAIPALLLLLAAGGCGTTVDPPPEPPTEPPTEEPTPAGSLTAVIEVDQSTGAVPLEVHFDSDASVAPHEVTGALWSFGPDGETATGRQASFTYTGSGSWTVTLTLTDVEGAVHAATTTIEVSPASCPEVLGTIETGVLVASQLDHVSGLAASVANPGVLWAHNDTESTARIFALGTDGSDLATFVLPEAVNTDWEDMALGRDPETGTSVLYLPDAGDDAANRSVFPVYMVVEPTAEEIDDAVGSTDIGWTSMTLAYPDDGAFDSETLLFDPPTGDLYIVSTDPGSGESHLFRKAHPHLAETTTELELVRSITAFEGGAVPNGGSISPLGDRILLRSWDVAFLWLRDGSQPFAAAFDGPACPMPVSEESGGESIEFSADSAGYFTTLRRRFAPLWQTLFVEPPAPCDGLEARFATTPPLGLNVPIEVGFEVDTHCIAEGLDSVEWTIDGQVTTELEPTIPFTHAGVVEVALTVVDTSGESDSRTGSIELLPQSCPVVGETQQWGEVESDQIDEASGLVASTRNPGVLWVHNDSGDTARLFAMAEDGTHLGIWTLPDDAQDWEGMAYGFDATLGREALYVGDVGDNGRTRESVTIHIVPEPDVDIGDDPVEVEITDAAAMIINYPDNEPFNCETVMWDPRTGDLYLVTKSSSITGIYRKAAPHVAGSFVVELVAQVDMDASPFTGSSLTTGGDISPTGDRILIRTYSDAWMWIREEGQSVADALAVRACDAEAPSENQGETVVFSLDGLGYITVSEGNAQPINYTPFVP